MRPDPRPKIIVGKDITATINAAIQALVDQGIVRERGHQLVEVLVDPMPLLDHDLQPREQESRPARTAAVTLHRLIELCNQAAVWVERRPVGGADGEVKFQDVEIRPPSWAVQTLMDRKSWPIATLRGVTETPFVRLDGTLIDQPGYDPVTRYHLAPPSGLAVHVHQHASLDDAQAAYARVLDLFTDFPFEMEAHAVGAIAAVLTLVARPAIRGPCPLFVVTSSTPGSGKSMLVDVIHAIGIGRKLERTTLPRREDELEKRVTSLLMASYAAACIDNIDAPFGGPTLDALITSTTWMGRELGRSHMVTVPARTILFATGNNIRLVGDMARRVVPIRIEPRMEHPEDRTDFRYPRILAHIQEHRAAILSDVLTILAAYCRNAPPQSPPGFGSFEDWSDLVRGALLWVGAVDPAVAARAWADDADEQRGEYEALAAAWFDTIGARPTTLSDLVSVAMNRGRDELLEALRVVAGRDGTIKAHLLGNRLRKVKGRVYAGYRFETQKDKTSNTALWTVERNQ